MCRVLPAAGKSGGSNPHATFPMFFLSEEDKMLQQSEEIKHKKRAKGVVSSADVATDTSDSPRSAKAR